MSEAPMKKQALLIGINEYEILPQLKFARQDAEAVEQSLKYNYCFSDDEITLLTDARSGEFKPTNRLRILTQLDNLANQDLDLLIFGFWGHGVVRNGKRYFCPIDVSQDAVEQLGVPFDVLMEKLSSIRAKNACLILDCCQRVHDGERGEEETFTAADQKTIENAARDIVFNRKKKEPEFVSNVAILNSCKQGQAAYEWDNRKHGIFTAHLLDAMNRRFSSVAQIADYVSQNVETTAKELNKKQTPLCSLEGSISLPVDTKTTSLETGDVFVSYRHSNADLVAPIEEELKNRGISYFIDHVGVNYTMEYASALAQAVKACKVLLFVWTQDADVSPDILREVSMALALKKRVLPYKIGTFDVTEHDSLFYQLAPISRYEVSSQTPETIVELVNQVERALTEKKYQQYSFVLPEKSQDAVIQKSVIEDINVTFTPGQIERQQRIQYDTIQLPPLPEALINIQAENKGRENAIAQLKDFTHESVSQANAAVAQAQAQFDAWVERKERLWKDLSKDVQQSLEKTISSNPECTEADIKVPMGHMSNQECFDFLERFECGRKFELARLELERVQNERQQKCDAVINELQLKIASENARVEEIRSQFMDEVLLCILAVMPGYDNLDAKFPSDFIREPLRLLDKYELGWQALAELSRARVLWKEQRPCELERKRKEEAKKHDLSIPGIKAGERKTVTVNGVEFAFRWCPAGTFTMGSPTSEEGRLDDETQHQVTLTNGFWMMETEVTQKQWKAIMGNNPSNFNGDDLPRDIVLSSSQRQENNPSNFKGDDLPVENVSWYDCQEFCKKCAQLGLLVQLPTEAQWEYACRAGTTGAYAGNLDDMAWYTSNSGSKTHPVGTKKPNAWGLYDMHGNVWEWCADWYGDYPSGSVADPTGPSDGSYRVYRGGSWSSNARLCRSAFCGSGVPEYRISDLGFRAVRGQ